MNSCTLAVNMSFAAYNDVEVKTDQIQMFLAGDVTEHGKESSHSFCIWNTQEYSFPLVSHFSLDIWLTVFYLPLLIEMQAQELFYLPPNSFMRKKSASNNDEKWHLTPCLGVEERVGSPGTCTLCIKLSLLGNGSSVLIGYPTIWQLIKLYFKMLLLFKETVWSSG